jgi:hypothetical protein
VVATPIIHSSPNTGLVAQRVGLTDGNGTAVNPAGSQGMAVDRGQRLAHEIWEAVDQFRAGKLSWRELARLKEQAQQLWAQLPDSQAVTLRQAVARIDAQGRTPGDDTGWDVVEVLKAHRNRAAKDNISHGELRRAYAFAQQAMTARQGHWVPGARENARQLIKDIDSKYLPALENLEVRQISAMEQTRRAFVQTPSHESRQALQQWRDLLNARFNANDFAPTNGQALRQTLAAANKALGTPGSASAAPSPQAHRPRAGDIRETDVDPDGSGPKKGTFVGVVARGDIALQTRLVNLQAFDGQRWVTQGYGVRDLIQVQNGRVRQQTSASKDLLNVSLDEAKRQARAWLSQSPQVTGKPRPRVASQPVEIIETLGLAIKPGGVPLSGPTGTRGFMQLIDQQAAPDAQRYLKAGNALIGLRGSDLPNYVGVAMDLMPNVTPVRGGGNQLLYSGEALQAIGTVSDALRAAGGEAPQVRAVPVYLRVGRDQLAKTTIFRVQGRDGRERIVDNVGRTYDSLEKWKQHNQLGAVDVFLPKGGQMQGLDGKVVLEAFNNRRFDNTALPAVRGAVAFLGTGAGVAVMLGTGGVAAPLVMAGGAVFSVVDGTARLTDLDQHGQQLALTNRQALAAWLDFGAGWLGVSAIGTGLKWVARASDLADLLTLGNDASDLASDWNKLSPGERVLAGAQIAFWASMLGASQFPGGRFNLDSLMKRAPGGSEVGAISGDPNINVPASRGRLNDGKNNNKTPVNQTQQSNGATPPGDTRVQIQQQIQQQSRQLFQSPEFRQLLTERVIPAELDAIATNPTRLLQLAQDVALETVVERSFSGSKVPRAVQQGFQSRAEAWAKQQVRVNGGTVARWLEVLVMDPNGSGHRAELLRPVVAEHLGGGNKRLQNAVAAQLRPLGESALKNLVAPGPDGGPQKASVDVLRKALVARWAEDYKLSPQEQNRLNQAIGQRLDPKSARDQIADLRSLDSLDETKKILVTQAQEPSETYDIGANNIRNIIGNGQNFSIEAIPHRDVYRVTIQSNGENHTIWLKYAPREEYQRSKNAKKSLSSIPEAKDILFIPSVIEADGIQIPSQILDAVRPPSGPNAERSSLLIIEDMGQDLIGIIGPQVSRERLGGDNVVERLTNLFIALDRLERNTSAHGDLLSNTFIIKNGRFGLIDFEEWFHPKLLTVNDNLKDLQIALKCYLDRGIITTQEAGRVNANVQSYLNSYPATPKPMKKEKDSANPVGEYYRMMVNDLILRGETDPVMQIALENTSWKGNSKVLGDVPLPTPVNAFFTSRTSAENGVRSFRNFVAAHRFPSGGMIFDAFKITDESDKLRGYLVSVWASKNENNHVTIGEGMDIQAEVVELWAKKNGLKAEKIDLNLNL